MTTDTDRANALKEQGNKCLQTNDLPGAIAKYTEALRLAPAPALYSNRALAYLKQNHFNDAMQDCQAALRLDPTFERASNRLAFIYVCLGDGTEALKHCRGAGADANDTRQRAMEMERFSRTTGELRAKLEETLSRALSNPLQVFPNEDSIKEFQQQSERLLNLSLQAHRLAPSSVQVAVALSAAYVIRQTAVDVEIANKRGREREAADRTFLNQAKSLLREALPFVAQQPEQAGRLHAEMESYVAFALGEFSDATGVLRRYIQAGHSDPALQALFKTIKGFEKAKDDAGALFKAGKYQPALDAYKRMIEEIVAVRELPFLPIAARMAASQCFNNRSFCYMKMGDYKKAVAEATVAVALNPAWSKAVLRRALAAEKSGDFQLCAHDYATLSRLATTRQEKAEYDAKHRQFEGKASKAAQINPYTILALPESDYKHKEIPEGVLKRAYKKACVQWHPDKWASASDEEKAKADTMIKDINEAYDILKDAKRKQIYDAGGDLRGGGMPDMGAAFGGMPHFSFTQGGGMPQGFQFGGDMSDILSMFMGGGMGGMGGMPGMSAGGRRGGRPNMHGFGF